MSNNLIRQLKKKGQLEVFQQEIQNKIDLGTLVELSSEELEGILQSTHHFCYLSMVMSENSESTAARMINNTKTEVPGFGMSYCLENTVPSSKIGDSHGSLMDFRIYNHPYSSDISNCP